MRTLFFCLRLPNPILGGIDLRLRSQIFAQLKKGPTAVMAVAGLGACPNKKIELWRSGSDPEPTNGRTSAELLELFARGKSHFTARFSTQIAAELADVIREFNPDVVVISSLECMPYFEAVRASHSGRIVLDLDVSQSSMTASVSTTHTTTAQAHVFRVLMKKALEFEFETTKKVKEIWLSSDIERIKFNNVYPHFLLDGGKISVIPNAIETNLYKSNQESREPRRIIFPARFDYLPNRQAAFYLINELMPRLPEFCLQIVGSNIPEEIRQTENSQVVITGQVTDMIPHLHRASLLVMPLRSGGGTRLKAIEALAAGLPIVSTKFGVEGLGLVPSEHYLEAESSDQFVTQCQLAESDEEIRRTLIRNGRDAVEKTLSLSALARDLEIALSPV